MPWLGIAAATAVAVTAAVLWPVLGGFVVPAAVAAATLVLVTPWPGWRSTNAVWIPLVPAAVSLAWTVAVIVTGRLGTVGDAGIAALIELGSLLALLGLVVRRAEGWALRVVPPALALAQLTWPLRFVPDRSVLALVGACALFGLGSAAVIATAAYLRWDERRLRRATADARAQQRRQLERDLHDYVAHDLSGIIVQAQAARFAGSTDPEALLRSLQRIETAGLQAMGSMDAVLELLRADDPRGTDMRIEPVARPTLDDLPSLVESFAQSWTGEVDVTVDARLDVARPQSELLYRVASEALTNVRRHAAPGSRVTVVLRDDPEANQACLDVEDRHQGPAAAAEERSRGGTGLRHLREQLERSGGTLTAGPMAHGWSVVACLPANGTGARQ